MKTGFFGPNQFFFELFNFNLSKLKFSKEETLSSKERIIMRGIKYSLIFGQDFIKTFLLGIQLKLIPRLINC